MSDPSAKPISAKAAAFVAEHSKAIKAALVGIVVAVGSSGLLLGGITVAISSLLVKSGLGLLEAMMIGFFSTGITGIVVGLVILVASVNAMRKQ